MKTSEEKRKYQREYRAANKEKARAAVRAWYAANPERVRKGQRDKWLKTAYGLTQEIFVALLVAQGGGCAICGSTVPGRGLKNHSVDHDHVTGKVRGLLCHGCNSGLGRFKDDPALLSRAVSYLGAHDYLFGAA